MEWLLEPTALAGLFTLVVLEIVLGIDNLVFIAILADKLPPHERNKARMVGLSLALLMRLFLLVSISWLVALSEPLVTIFGKGFSGRDLIFLAGGLFLLYKATKELHERLEAKKHEDGKPKTIAKFWAVIAQIVVLDAVFSIDSVITAVGMVDHILIMMIAVVIAMGVMMLASKWLTKFVSEHPTVIVLCLGFLMMIGFSLIADGAGFHVPKGYLYAAIGFSVLVEAFNQTVRFKRKQEFSGMTMRERTAEAVLRLLGGTLETESVGDDIGDIVANSDDKTVFKKEEMLMLERVLNLHDTKITAVMTHRKDIVWLEANEKRESILEKIRTYRHSRYPLCEKSLDNILGIIVVKDLLLKSNENIALKDLVRQPISLLESTSVLRALEIFKQSVSGFAIVVDEYGALQGVLTLKDLMENIVGMLPEPSYREDYSGVKADDGSWIVDGGLSIPDVEELISVRNMTDDDGDFNTLAGFMLFHLGEIPKVGDSFVWENLWFEVVDMDRRRIDKVIIKPHSTNTDANEI